MAMVDIAGDEGIPRCDGGAWKEIEELSSLDQGSASTIGPDEGIGDVEGAGDGVLELRMNSSGIHQVLLCSAVLHHVEEMGMGDLSVGDASLCRKLIRCCGRVHPVL
jgi:hypothetical protein